MKASYRRSLKFSQSSSMQNLTHKTRLSSKIYQHLHSLVMCILNILLLDFTSKINYIQQILEVLSEKTKMNPTYRHNHSTEQTIVCCFKIVVVTSKIFIFSFIILIIIFTKN